jgi:hypothetical protein
MPNQRNRSIEILLRQRRESDVVSDVSPQCLDAETLAAWVEGALAGGALTDAEKHAASCARCQALLASMARTMPEADARAGWQILSAKWLVPVAAVATALLVWISVGQSPEPAPKAAPPAVAPAASPRASAAGPVEPAAQGQNGQPLADSRVPAATDASKLKKETEERQAGSAGGSGQPAQQKPVSEPQRLDALDKTADAISPQFRARSESATEAARRVAEAPAAATPVTPAAPPPPAGPQQQQVTPPASQQTQAAPVIPVQPVTEAVTITSEAASKPAAGRGGGAGGGVGGGVGGGRVAFGAVSEIRSPQSDYRWRIVPPSAIQRSVDGGLTWSVVDPVLAKDAAGQREALQRVLAAGSSPSRDVCWIVGRAGVVLLTTDGATWQRRSTPETVDLTAVRAVDARSATVTTADGRQFVTADGGVTWTLSRQNP